MAKFRLRQLVKKIETPEVRTVEEIREGNGEPMYSIQLGRDFATRIWAKESELEAAAQPLRSEPADGTRRLWGSKTEDAQLCADVAEQLAKDHPPKAGDTVIFPAGHCAKIHSTSEGMAWLANQDGTMSERHIPLGDLAPSGEPNTWLYTGDTRAEK